MKQLLQITITTSILSDLRDFYVNVFGFIEISEWAKPKQGLRAIKLQRKEIILELIKSGNLETNDLPFSMNKQGLNMIGFVVDDAKETIKLVINHGGSLHAPITQGVTVKSIAFILDPDGNGIELIETMNPFQN